MKKLHKAVRELKIGRETAQHYRMEGTRQIQGTGSG